MAERGGQPGNNNASKGKPWRDAIDRALAAREKSRVDGKKALDLLAEELLKKCDDGDMTALKELGDRVEGRPAQSLTVSGDEDNPLELVTKVEIVPLVNKTDSDT
jgi:hypothetical protein